MELNELLEKAAKDAVLTLQDIADDPVQKAADRVRACDILLTRGSGNFDVAPKIVFTGEDEIA